MVHASILSLNYLWFFLFVFNTWIPFALQFHYTLTLILLWHFRFVNILFPLTYKSSMMRSGWICPFVLWQKLCITSNCNSRENVTLIFTQQHLMTMFMLSNSLHCIDNTCKVVQLVMDPIKMNCCWGRHKDWVILPNLWLMWQITHLGHFSQIALHTSREKRCLGLPNNLLIVF